MGTFYLVFSNKAKVVLFFISLFFNPEILEVNLFAFAYRLFHGENSSWNSLQANANKLTSRISVYKSSPSSTVPLVIPE